MPSCSGEGPPGRERIEFAVVALVIYEIADVGISGRKCIRKIKRRTGFCLILFGGMISNVSYESITRKPPA